jgi:transcriptional regulator with XRE-family HTH domain
MTGANKKFRELISNKPNFLGDLSDAQICNYVAINLYELRENAGLTQKELAERLNVKQSNISRWEQPGYQGYKLKMLNKIVRNLGGALNVSFTKPTYNLIQAKKIMFSYKSTTKDLSAGTETTTQLDFENYSVTAVATAESKGI